MNVTFLKIALIGCLVIALGTTGWLEQRVLADPDGSPQGRTGAPGETTCAASGCHSTYALNSGTGKIEITGLPANGYSPGQAINVTVTLTQTGIVRWGFTLTALDDQGRAAGTLAVSDSTRTRLRTGVFGGGTRQYLTHTTQGNTVNTWTMRWTAPAQSVGKVTFYAAGNAANNNGSASGDYIYTTTASLSPVASVATVSATSAASFVANGALSTQSIASLFGANLASSTVVATTTPLPTDLGGIKVRIKDAAGTDRDAPLFFVSAGQINFLVPAEVSNGAATLTVLRDGNPVGQGSVNIEAVTPGIFTASSNGQGVAAAVVLRVKADGTQSYEPVARLNQAGTAFEPVPINLGSEGEQVFLIAYGTGFRNRSALSNASVTLGGTTAELFYVGAQGDLAGLDQANIRIPRSLAGRGTVNFTLTVDGKNSNTATIHMQ